MTLEEAIRLACKLTDGEKSDYEVDFPFLADNAQKWIATQGKHIERSKLITIENCDEAYELPGDFHQMSPKGIVMIKYPKKNVDFVLEHNLSTEGKEVYKIKFFGNGEYLLHYFAMPQTITSETADEYVFEVPVETHAAIPYFIGYHLVMDETTLYTQLKNEWNRYMSVFKDTVSAREVQINNPYLGMGRSGF